MFLVFKGFIIYFDTSSDFTYETWNACYVEFFHQPSYIACRGIDEDFTFAWCGPTAHRGHRVEWGICGHIFVWNLEFLQDKQKWKNHVDNRLHFYGNFRRHCGDCLFINRQKTRSLNYDETILDEISKWSYCGRSCLSFLDFQRWNQSFCKLSSNTHSK